jgi:hypothetical protein
VDDIASETLEDGDGHCTRFWMRHRADNSPPPPL